MKKILTILRKPRNLRILFGATIFILVFGGFLFYQARKGRIFIDDSLVSAPLITISPATPGKLNSLSVYENESIQKGDAIAVVGDQTLRADNNGLVVMVNNQIGGLLNSQTPVVQMILPETMRIAGTIDENKGLSDIHVGQVASFTIDALPGETFWGYVDEISPTAKQTQIAFSISSERPTQQFVVYVKYDSAKYQEIKNGMSAKITVYTNTN